MEPTHPPHAEVPVRSEAKDGPRSTHRADPASSGTSFEAAPTASDPHLRMRRFGGIGRRIAFALIFACLIAPAAPLALRAAVANVELPSLTPATGKIVVDKNGVLLRAFTTPDGIWRLPVTVEDVDPLFLKTLFAFEDRRFRVHHGVDVRALFRAGFQLLTEWRPVSGASTITMQVARLLDKELTRSVTGKLNQILTALALEKRLSKEEISNLYLMLAPYGGNIEGIRAASLAYLGKEPRRLTPAEAALLVALPQSPQARRPDRYAAAAQVARDRVLERAEEAGVLTADDVKAARSEPVPKVRRPFPMLAPHTAERIIAQSPDAQIYRVSIDAGLQSRLQSLASERAAATLRFRLRRDPRRRP